MSLDNGDNIIAVLIEKCKFIQRFSDAFKKESDRTVGYLGHLVHLSNELTKASTYHEPLARLLDENDLWKELVNGRLKEINDRNNTPIGAPPAGGSPMMVRNRFRRARACVSCDSLTRSYSTFRVTLAWARWVVVTAFSTRSREYNTRRTAPMRRSTMTEGLSLLTRARERKRVLHTLHHHHHPSDSNTRSSSFRLPSPRLCS